MNTEYIAAPSDRPSRFVKWVVSKLSSSNPESHVRLSAKARKIIDDPKLSSEMVRKLIEEKNNFIEGEPITIGLNGKTISISKVSDSKIITKP